MGKHRLVTSDGSQWGGPDLITGTASPADRERAEPIAEPVPDDWSVSSDA
ncbi:hypothetical protein [Saccharothrix lopnurensis]|uniref:Uncharacterized protein n=1 Tax=Saccharothrix lopnurensis TaxID=1670621 RepID=A0ABW1P2N4_9PSEU